jgi:hypothetical protein
MLALVVLALVEVELVVLAVVHIMEVRVLFLVKADQVELQEPLVAVLVALAEVIVGVVAVMAVMAVALKHIDAVAYF